MIEPDNLAEQVKALISSLLLCLPAAEAKDWIDTLGGLHKEIYIQEYIESEGKDYRIIVIDGKVIGGMERVARKGDWKTNVSLGAKPSDYKPSALVKEIAIKSAEAVKADVCGVDIIIWENQPYVIEVNQCPHFKGFEKATGKNVAKRIVKFALRKARR